jgi:hypothetical protein
LALFILMVTLPSASVNDGKRNVPTANMVVHEIVRHADASSSNAIASYKGGFHCHVPFALAQPGKPGSKSSYKVKFIVFWQRLK